MEREGRLSESLDKYRETRESIKRYMHEGSEESLKESIGLLDESIKLFDDAYKSGSVKEMENYLVLLMNGLQITKWYISRGDLPQKILEYNLESLDRMTEFLEKW